MTQSLREINHVKGREFQAERAAYAKALWQAGAQPVCGTGSRMTWLVVWAVRVRG